MGQDLAEKIDKKEKKIEIFSSILPGRDEIYLDLEWTSQKPSSGQTPSEDLEVFSFRWRAIGCPEVLTLVDEWRKVFQSSSIKTLQDLKKLKLPKGNSHAEIMMREVLLKARGEWNYPYNEEEICHCREVRASVVDAAIVGGAESIEEIRRLTMACTSCRTCQPDIEKLLQFRRR